MPSVILACGLQKAFLDPKGSKYLGERSETLKVRLKSFFNTPLCSNSIIYLIREIHEQGDDFYQAQKAHSLVGSLDIEIPEIFKPHFKLIINSSRYSSFHQTPLESELHKIKPDKVTLVGFETHTSILFTAEELRNRGYNVSIFEPLVTSEDDYLHAAGITLLRNFLGVTIED